MNKFAIFTALIGGYDCIMQPQVIDERFDYILFTDEVVQSRVGIWEVRRVEYDNPDKTRIARWVKTHSHSLLSQYKATLWIDANLEILSSYVYERCIALNNRGIQLASVKHPLRDCIYDEAYKVYELDKEQNIFNWCHYLRSVDYPKHNGLYETNVLYRKNDTDVAKINEEWWNAISQYSRRDQLSLNYILQNNDISQDYFLPKEESTFTSHDICHRSHNKVAGTTGRRILKKTKWEHLRDRCRMGLPSKQESFKKVYYFIYQFPLPIGRFLLNMWTIYAIIVYGPRIKFEAYQRHKKAAVRS